MHRQFIKRVSASLTGIVTVFVLLAVRLFFLQVINNDKYKLLADKNRIFTTYSTAPRGTIIDRNGKVLATSSFSYRAAVDLNQFRQFDWGVISKTLKIDEPLSTYIEKQIRQVGPASVIPIKDNLSWKEIVAVEMLSSQISGLMVIPKIIRVYPYENACSHCVGYVTRPNREDIDKNANLKVIDASIGKMGIERYCDAALQGTIGIKQVEVNAARRMVRLIDEQKPVKGQDVTLTVDIDFQQEVMNIMQGVRCGVAIVMNVNTGEILASVSIPTFDPNIFAKAVTPQEWKMLIEGKDLPLINRSVSGLYAPGSTFKPVVAIAALNNGVLLKQTRFNCVGYYEVNQHRFHCHRWRTGGHGPMDVIRALEQSCDVFFYNVAVKLGSSAIIGAARDFGFGSLTNIELFEEKKGQIPSPSKMLQKQLIGQSINLAIGQGEFSATPLQLLTMTARLASEKRVAPHIIKAKSQEEAPKMTYSKDAFLTTKAGLAAVVKTGTARSARNDLCSFAGKTGSTQVCRITKEERQRGKLIERPYHLKDHALFIGYAPADTPRFAVVVVVEHGESGGRIAAPLGGKILVTAMSHDWGS
jgi:penicillin-binding protein 2